MPIKKPIIFLSILIVIIVVGSLIYYLNNQADESLITDDSLTTIEQMSEKPKILSQLETNYTKTSISFDEILSGGPGKDGIPALTNPKFTSLEQASSNILDDTVGILVTDGDKSKFYPYNIMLWHEVVNDTVGGRKLLVTFCPLCGSAIVFDRVVNDEVLEFGVSGLLYESNLLMYDKATESLWSQVLGEAVVGDKLGVKLEHYPFQLLDFKVVKDRYPTAQILSEDTGFRRNYSINPYGRYEDNEQLYFPVSFMDERLPAKELMYIVELDDVSVALRANDLSENSEEITAGNNQLMAYKREGEVEVRRQDTNELIPGYYAIWFSWAVHHQDNGVVWMK